MAQQSPGFQKERRGRLNLLYVAFLVNRIRKRAERAIPSGPEEDKEILDLLGQ